MDYTKLTFLSGIVCGTALGITFYYLRNILRTRAEVKEEVVEEAKYSADGEYRIALIVRSDLNMSKGKIAAQCGHGAVGAIEEAQKRDPNLLKEYKANGQTKVVFKINSEAAIKSLRKVAREIGVITSMIRDAGRTQIAANSVTVLAIGPAQKDVINMLTEELKPL